MASTLVFGDVRVQRRQALHLGHVDDALVVCNVQVHVRGAVRVAPVKLVAHHDAAVGECGRIRFAADHPLPVPVAKNRPPQSMAPSIPLAYGSSSSLAGLHRRPLAGSHGPSTR